MLGIIVVFKMLYKKCLAYLKFKTVAFIAKVTVNEFRQIWACMKIGSMDSKL